MDMITAKTTTANVGAIREYFIQGLDKLACELESYPNDWSVWIKEGGIGSSAGSLCLYLIQTLDHSMAILQGTKLKEEIKRPFSNPSRAELVQEIEITKVFVEEVFQGITDESLDQEFPLAFRDNQVSTSNYLLYLLTELHYRLGQVNYHRRLI